MEPHVSLASSTSAKYVRARGTSSRRFARYSWALACVTVCGTAIGNTVFLGTVSAVGSYGNGSIFIILNSPVISEPGCTSGSRIDVSTANPNYKQIFALAMTAKATGQRITGAVNGCDPSIASPTIDNSFQSYIYILDN